MGEVTRDGAYRKSQTDFFYTLLLKNGRISVFGRTLLLEFVNELANGDRSSDAAFLVTAVGMGSFS